MNSCFKSFQRPVLLRLSFTLISKDLNLQGFLQLFTASFRFKVSKYDFGF